MDKNNSSQSRRQSIIENKKDNSKSVKIPNPHYVKEKVDKPKEKYSEYLIRMLEESPKKFRIRPQMSTFIKTNNKFLKNRTNFYLNKTNYKTRPKKSKIPIEQNVNDKEENEINEVKKKYSIKDPYYNTITDYNDRKKSITKLMKNKDDKDSNNNNDNTNANDNIDQLTFSKYNEDINNKDRQLNSNFSSTNQILTVNNSINTPNLMTKSSFKNNKNNKNNIYNKTISNISSVRNINRIRLNALYGYDKNFVKSKRYLQKEKFLIDLENYQDDILKVSQRNLSKDHLIKLYTELKSIKSNAEMVKPLPPINYPALILHSCNEDKKDRRKNKSKMNFDNKKFKELDDYEKELYEIKKSNEFKRAKIVRNKRLYKIYEILPEHVIDVLYKKRNKLK